MISKGLIMHCSVGNAERGIREREKGHRRGEEDTDDLLLVFSMSMRWGALTYKEMV